MRWTCLAVVLVGCTACVTYEDVCGDLPPLEEIGVVSNEPQRWKVTDDVSVDRQAFAEVVFRAGRCFARRRAPILLESESGTFLGIARYRRLSGPISASEIGLVLDDFSTNQFNPNRARLCEPSELDVLEVKYEIADIRARLIVSRENDHHDSRLAYASSWLLNCIPSLGPVAWVTTEGHFIAEYDPTYAEPLRRY